MMARTGCKFAIAHGAQFAAQRLLGDHDAEFLVNPLAEVDDPPSYDAMSGRNRAALDDRCQRGSVCIVQPRRLSRRLAIDQAVRPERVELEHPIANDLKRHTANLRRLGASCAFVNRRQSQKPPCWRAILRSFRGGPDHLRVKIGPKRNGHGEPPLFATLNHLAADSKIPNRVTLSGIWYNGGLNVLPVSPNGGNFVALDGDFQTSPLTQTISGLIPDHTYSVSFD